MQPPQSTVSDIERERYPAFALSVATEGEKFRSRRTRYDKTAFQDRRCA